MSKIELKENIALEFIIFTLLAIISNILFYYLLGFFLTNTQSYLYVPSFRILIENSFDFLNQVPTIAISGIIALITIFFTIIALSFNLNSKIPDKIIYKYIIYNRRVTIYLSVLTGFLLIQLSVMLFNWYGVYWSYVFIFDLILSLIATIIFFYWFVKITNKKGLFKVLENNIYRKCLSTSNFNNNILNNAEKVVIESSGDYLILKSRLFDEKKIPKTTPQIITSKTAPSYLSYNEKEGLQQHSFAHISGLVKIDTKELDHLIRDNLDILNYLVIPKDGVFISQMGLLCKLCFFTEDERKIAELVKRLSKVLKIVEVKEEIKEINDWLLFLDHSRSRNPKEIEDDFKFLKNVLTKIISNKQFHLLKLIFDTLRNSFNNELKNNEKILEQTISLIYGLRENYNKNVMLLSFMQSKFKSIIINYSPTLETRYSSKYASAILYLSEFVRFDFMRKFENEKDVNKLGQYKNILQDNIEFSNEILTNTINMYFKNSKYYETYLKEHMQQFISGLQFYYDEQYHYDRNYYDLSQDEKEIINEKCKIIRECKETRKNRITTSAFYLLNLVEQKKISSKLSSLILDFLEFGDAYAEIDPAPSWIMGEKLHPEGAFVVPRFPKEKYIIIYLIYSDLDKNKIPQPGWEHNKLHLAQELKKNVEDITYEEVLFWIDIKVEKFEEIKKKLIDMFSEAIMKCNKDEQNKIVDSNIDPDIVKKFEESINNYFNDSAVLRKIFQTNNNYEEKLDKNPKKKPNQSFGFFFTFEKSYFIKNPPVSWARTLESDYGMSLARNENEQILKEIIATKKISKLKQSLEISIVRGIKKFKKKESLIIIIDNSKDDELNQITLFTHKYKIQRNLNDEEKHFSFKGTLKFEEIEIPVYEFNVGALIILNMRVAGKLVQYSPYNGINKRVYIGVEELNQKDIETLKDIEAPKTKVKVRILEKFRVENINKNSFQSYTLNKDVNQNE